MTVEFKRRGQLFASLALASLALVVLIPRHFTSHFRGSHRAGPKDWYSISIDGMAFALGLWSAWRNRRNVTSLFLDAKEWTISKDGRTIYAGPPLAQDRIAEDGVDFFLSPPGFNGEIRIPKRLIPRADADRFLRRIGPIGV